MMEYERESMGMNGAVYNAGRVVWSRCLLQAVGVYLKEKKPDDQHDVCGTKKARPVVRSADKPCRGGIVLRVMGRDYLTRIT